MRIESKVIPNAYWEIERQIVYNAKHSPEIIEVENEFIANYNPVIYNDDLTGKQWCYDIKLSSVNWLENITVQIKNGKVVYRALILC